MTKRILLLTLYLLAIMGGVNAQSKVFKEVNDEISTSMKAIIQDGALVGYLTFTQLEKVTEDSFNYKVTILDENLNDLGKVNFKDERMSLVAVSFEQDILCLAYFKSNIIGKEFKNRKEFDGFTNRENKVVLQFLNLDGKLLKTSNIPVNIDIAANNWGTRKVTASGSLKHEIQLKNVPQKGFVCFFADSDDYPIVMFNTSGEQLWKKSISSEKFYVMLTSPDAVFMLTKAKKSEGQAGYEMSSYSATDGKGLISHFSLEDKDGNPLNVLSFQNDPVSGIPFVAGNIIKEKIKVFTGRKIKRGAYLGLYSIDFTGKTAKDIKQNYSYWNDKSKMPDISSKGRYSESKSFMNYSSCVRDFQGNTYFAGSEVASRVRVGAIIVSIILLPAIIISPIYMASAGVNKYRVRDAMVVKLDPKSNLSFEQKIDCQGTSFHSFREDVRSFDNKEFFQVSNSVNKSNYLVVDDQKDIIIYSIAQKKVVRTVSHKDGKSTLNIYPAKEGHIMVSEYNKKEKYTRLSIESL